MCDNPKPKADARVSALQLTHHEAARRTLRHVQSATVAFRRHGDDVWRAPIDNICESRIKRHLRDAVDEGRLTVILYGRFALGRRIFANRMCLPAAEIGRAS